MTPLTEIKRRAALEAERQAVEEALREHGSLNRAARALGVDVANLRRAVRRHGLRRARP